METKKLKIIIAFVLMLFTALSPIHAQEAVTTSGGNAIGIGGSVGYSIGQVFYITNNGTNGSVLQGVQQPYEISVAFGIDEDNAFTMFYSAFPNPTDDFVILKVKNCIADNLYYQLYDLNGKLLMFNKIENDETTIEMKKYPSSTYQLKVRNNQKIIKAFQIIKK